MPYRRDTRDAPGNVSFLLLCALFVLLTGCEPCAPEAKIPGYLSRPDLHAPCVSTSAQANGISAPPLPAGLQPNLTRSNLDKIDFLTLHGCAVQATVGKYNTELGREAKPSQRLLLELEYLQLAPACMIHLRQSNRDALADTLAAAWWRAYKRLPARIFAATLGSDEYRSFWQPARIPGDYPPVSSEVAISALEAINRQSRRWLSGDYQADNRDFEVLLSEVAGGGPVDRGGADFPAAITALEAQLATVLPPSYTRWVDQRNHGLNAAGGSPHE